MIPELIPDRALSYDIPLMVCCKPCRLLLVHLADMSCQVPHFCRAKWHDSDLCTIFLFLLGGDPRSDKLWPSELELVTLTGLFCLLCPRSPV